ncbi:hypothetical protein GGQ74_002868 [Desulfobaculum xiamenense]|uniref:Uncharacterized protein n=1 Tax=Desulfobaculum xiamenense TaxID=995050 RepID=A0A846QM39_9BACT|nr:hypothetical protein [Desulfobaculum xiamenense]
MGAREDAKADAPTSCTVENRGAGCDWRLSRRNHGRS